eukprot:643274-Hanusia_phi.AAC.1
MLYLLQPEERHCAAPEHWQGVPRPETYLSGPPMDLRKGDPIAQERRRLEDEPPHPGSATR